MPVPASLFLIRGEQAAAAGLGVSGAAAGGSAAVGGGVAAGFVAKAIAVAAAASVAGGVGYGVSHHPRANAEHAKAAPASVTALTPRLRPAPVIAPAPTRNTRRLQPVPTVPSAQDKPGPKAKAPKQRVAAGLARAPQKTRHVAKTPWISKGKLARLVKTRPLTPGAAKPVAARARTRPDTVKKVRLNRPARMKPPRPTHLAQKAKPAKPNPHPSPHAKPPPAAKDTGRGLKEEPPG
jgi:hypothetical protein